MTKQAVAHQKFIRQTPQKLRLIANMIRPLKVEEAVIQLKVSSKRGAIVILKVLTQAKTNATNIGLRSETLKIHSIEISEGPTFKRWNPVSRGRAHKILKRTSHIKIILEGSSQPIQKTTEVKSKKTDKKGK